MPKVIWSRNALSDVHRLYQFLAGKNPDAARRAAKTIRQSVKLMSAHPDAGRHPDGMESDYRELIVGFGDSGYVALYRCDGDVCVILAVRHQKEAWY